MYDNDDNIIIKSDLELNKVVLRSSFSICVAQNGAVKNAFQRFDIEPQHQRQ